MEKIIMSILADLYEIDPGLRDREEDLKNAIAEILANKPDVKIDKNFKAKLKAELLNRLGQTVKKRRLFALAWISNIAVRRVLGVLLAGMIAAVLFVYFNPYKVKSAGEKYQPPRPVPEMQKSEQKPAISAKQPVNIKRNTLDMSIKENEAGDMKQKEILQEEQVVNSAAAGKKDSEVYPKEAPPSGLSINARYNSNDWNTESYNRITENNFKEVIKEPLSTLSIDVDTASYANIRRFIQEGSLPNPDAVRIEEMVNYFTYHYDEPKGSDPFSFHTELSGCPWNPSNQLLLIGMQAKKVDLKDLPPNNLVFLIDVSGSMDEPNKLPLIKSGLKLLVNEMRPQDRISIVVYAGAAGIVLEPTPGSNKKKILDALENLEAGGSTAGGEGLALAYKTAEKNYHSGVNNRIILATDGDFNVGASSDADMTRLVEKERDKGIYITVLGFGMGNYKDSKMESIADKGNGNYAYIDSLLEARKVLVSQMGGTLFTVAKDVKLQIEFNPGIIKEYRLIGYEDRIMPNEDFSNDKKDAGELGAGHTVTALYELVLSDGKTSGNELKYQKVEVKKEALENKELMTIKFRYKKPGEDVSRLLTYPVKYDPMPITGTSGDFRFAAAVAEWGLILRNSEFKAKAGYSQVFDLAKDALGKDEEGYRVEFLNLVKKSEQMSGNK